MDLPEAHRQYQTALEYHRTVVREAEGMVSMNDVIADAKFDLDRAEAALFSCWMQQQGSTR